MKKAIFVTSLILLFSVFALAQKNKQSPGLVEADSPAKESSKKSSPIQAGTTLDAQLQSTLDVKNAQVGDQVVLRTTKSIKQNGETIIPKGSNLIGRVTEVQQKSKNNKTSRIGMIFDRIEGKNLEAPISASIVSISNVAAAVQATDLFSSDVSGSSSTSGRTSTGSSTGGGGLLGGVTNTVGGVVNTTTQTVGGVANTAGQTLGSTTQTLGRTVNGIQISKSVSGSAQSSTTLSAQDKNIRLEKGTSFQLLLNGTTGN